MRKSLCKRCSCELNIANIRKLEDLDFTKVGYYCVRCLASEEEALKKSRFVEEYRGQSIYSKDDKYAPYWHSWYCYDSIEDAKKRIDAAKKGIGVY